MASNSTVSRYRPAIAVLAALAAGYTVYYIHSTRQLSADSPSSSRRLRRRNAIIPRRSARRQDDTLRDAANFPRSTYNAGQLLDAFRAYSDISATFRHSLGTNEQGRQIIFEIPLSTTDFPSLEQIEHACGINKEAAEDVRQNYETALMQSFLCQRLPPNCTLNDDPEAYATAFEAEDFMFTDSILTPIAQFNSGAYEHLDERREAYTGRGVRPPTRRRLRSGQDSGEADNQEPEQSPPHTPTIVMPEGDQSFEVEDLALQADDDVEADDESEQDWNADENDESRREGQSLLNLLYHIAEDQARREGVVHRGVSCNSCNATPIKGIRYRCTNCVDYDLCEQCESMQFHQKNHLFIKIRIPTPSHSSSRRPQPIWYPGNALSLPNNLPRDLNKSVSEETGFSDNEVDALWDQFKTLAAAVWPEDPDDLDWAIDREAFDKCFIVSPEATRTPPASLIYDRTFAFYDSNHDGLIGFREFVAGLAAARSKDVDERHRRTFNEFDFDGDGYISRRDLLLIFRAYYALQREFTRELVTDMEADLLEGGTLRESITSNQPISAAYHGSFHPQSVHVGEGKQQDEHGDLVVVDNRGAIAEDANDEGDLVQMIGDLREVAQFGNVEPDDLVKLDANASTRETRTSNQAASDVASMGTRTTEISAPEPIDRENTPETLAQEPEWPPAHVADRDVERALGRTVALGEVTNEVDRGKVLKAAANRIKAEEERPTRQQVRESAVRNRLNRRQFYLDDEQRLLDSQTIQRQVSQTAASNGVEHGNQGLVSTGRSDEASNRSNRPQKLHNHGPGPEQPVGSTVFREPPPLPKNPGQEILYQITQESINELLDPMFKLREDIGMESIKLIPFFKMFKDHLEIFREDTMVDLCRLQINRFQQQWRTSLEDFTLRHPSVSSIIQRKILNEWDEDHEEYSLNLLDMHHVGMIEKEVVDQHFRDKERRDKAKAKVQLSKDLIFGASRSQPAPQDQAVPVPSQSNTPESTGDAQQGLPSAALDLSRSVDLFNSSDPNIEEVIRTQALPDLLDSAGYSVAEDRPDPTLPQNRPTIVPPQGESLEAIEEDALDPSEPPPVVLRRAASEKIASGACQATDTSLTDRNPWTDIPAHDDQSQWTDRFRRFLKYMTMMELVREEDEKRDGEGKLSRAEYEELVKGPKAQNLAFLGGWIDYHAL
ncbi:hypothetical protein MMC10_009393 [Thelotrema lepadinum]|nr:hypothetical protein [Thelotrema lepadinum]